MFYIKTELPDGKTVKTEVTDENVFTRCPGCGDEVSVDLAELFSDSESDLYGTCLLYTSTLKRFEQVIQMDV